MPDELPFLPVEHEPDAEQLPAVRDFPVALVPDLDDGILEELFRIVALACVLELQNPMEVPGRELKVAPTEGKASFLLRFQSCNHANPLLRH